MSRYPQRIPGEREREGGGEVKREGGEGGRKRKKGRKKEKEGGEGGKETREKKGVGR